jgi:predicted N-acetyltransferase YhbS
MEITIVNLAERLEYLDAVSEWFWHEWGANQTIENMQYTTRHTTQVGRVPLTYIALAGERLVGTVSVWCNDLRCRQDLTPWLTNLYVAAEMRDQGIATLLQNRMTEEVRALGYEEMYLIASDEEASYYEETGWSYMELAPMTNGVMTRVYRKNLSVE